MIDCKTAWNTLNNINLKKASKISTGEFNDLMSLGLLSRVAGSANISADDSALSGLRRQLTDINTSKKDINKRLMEFEKSFSSLDPRKLFKYNEYKTLRKQLVEQETKENMLRTQFLNLLQKTAEKQDYATVNNEPVVLTYKGRELLGTLSERLIRVGKMKLNKYMQDLEDIKSIFNNTSRTAAEILKTISPRFKSIDEIHLRFSAVGLANKPKRTEQIISNYITAVSELKKSLTILQPVLLTLAEAIAVNVKEQPEFNKFITEARQMLTYSWDARYISDDQFRAVAIILSARKDSNYLSELTKLIAINHCPKIYSAAAFLASLVLEEAVGGGKSGRLPQDKEQLLASDVLNRFGYFKNYIDQFSSNTEESSMAAALLCSSGLPDNAVIERLQLANNILKKFNGNSVLMLSAMLAIMPFEIEEALDNVRLASAAIRENKLSLGGMENLSLGVKLFLNSSIQNLLPVSQPSGALSIVSTSSHVEPGLMGAAGISAAAAGTVGVGLLAFHEVSLHRFAVRDHDFHPVHVHYVYG